MYSCWMLHDLRCVQQNGCLQLLKKLPYTYNTTFGGCNRASTLLNMSNEISFAPLHSQLLADLEFRHCQMHYLLQCPWEGAKSNFDFSENKFKKCKFKFKSWCYLRPRAKLWPQNVEVETHLHFDQWNIRRSG